MQMMHMMDSFEAQKEWKMAKKEKIEEQWNQNELE